MITPKEIEQCLSELKTPRITLYINEKRTKDFYDQFGGPDQNSASTEIGSELSSELKFWIAGIASKILGKKGQIKAKDISKSSQLMALVIEFHVKQRGELLDMSVERFGQKGWARYVGDGCITKKGKILTVEKTNLPKEALGVIHDERLRQQAEWEPPESIVWTASGLTPLASVANAKWVDDDDLASYAHNPIGIFGRPEQQKGGVAFVSPIWIWHEGK